MRARPLEAARERDPVDLERDAAGLGRELVAFEREPAALERVPVALARELLSPRRGGWPALAAGMAVLCLAILAVGL